MTQAGKFGIVPTIINLAAALALLSLVGSPVGEKRGRSAAFTASPLSLAGSSGYRLGYADVHEEKGSLQETQGVRPDGGCRRGIGE